MRRVRSQRISNTTGAVARSASSTGTSARINLASGDVSCSSTTWAAISASGLDMVLGDATTNPITAGMKIQVTLMGFSGSATPGLFLDVATIVSAAPVSFVSGLANASNTDAGVAGWRCGGSTNTNISGTMLYTVVSGDISASTVTLRPYFVLSTAGSRSILSNANAPFTAWAQLVG